MDSIEIELKFRVENINHFKDFLRKHAQYKGEKHQIDEYFTPYHRDFLAVRPTKEWLRLRNQDGKYSITYKNWHIEVDGSSHYCDEYESVIEDIYQLHKVFEALDMRSLTIVDKKREMWHYDNYEITLDSVANLGDFVEIEYKGPDDPNDPQHTRIRDAMITFLLSHDCGKIERNDQGYPFLLLFPDEAKFTTV